jgi:hypothetical protein
MNGITENNDFDCLNPVSTGYVDCGLHSFSYYSHQRVGINRYIWLSSYVAMLCDNDHQYPIVSVALLLVNCLKIATIIGYLALLSGTVSYGLIG